MNVTIHFISVIPADSLSLLVAESEREGFRFIRRLVDEWESNINRFDRPGEKLFVARLGSTIIGVCGLNVDPYATDQKIGRVRRFYVMPDYRRQGIARQLIETIQHAAQGIFQTLRLRTTNPQAARLYRQVGFNQIDNDAYSTHIMRLPPDQQGLPNTSSSQERQ